MEEETKEETSDKPVSVVKQANIAKKELEEENERMEKNIAELKELKAIGALSGNTEPAKEDEKKEETPLEYKDRIMSTGKVDG